MKKIILTTMAMVGLWMNADAAFIWNWSHRTGAFSGDRGKCVSNVVNGSIASSGWYQGTVDFDPSPGGVLNLVSAVAPSPSDMYVSMYNSTTGALVWARSITGTGVEEPMNMVTHPGTGYVYVCGKFSGSCDFDPHPINTATCLTSGASDFDGFIACYTNLGAFVWVRQIGSTTARDAVNGIAFDSGGNLVVCGEFGGTVNFGGVSLISYGGTDAFVARYSSAAGALLGSYAYQMGGTLNDAANGICVTAAGEIYLTGWYTSALADFDPFGAGGVISTSGSSDVFTLKFIGATFGWVETAGTPGTDYGNDVMQYGNYVIITGGMGLGNVSFAGGPTVWTVTGTGTDAYLAAYPVTGGAPSWVAPFIGTGDDMGQNICSDNQGYVYCTGYFSSVTIDFNEWTGLTWALANTQTNTSAAGTYDLFYARYNTAGAHKDSWSTGSAVGEDCPGLFAWRNPATGANEMFVTGSFSQTTNFDPLGAAAASHTAPGLFARDIFLAKYNWTSPLRMMNPALNTAEFRCYPNPASSTLQLDNLAENSTVEMYSLDGKLAGTWTANANWLTINVGEFENGVYLLRVTDAEGEMKTEKVVVRH